MSAHTKDQGRMINGRTPYQVFIEEAAKQTEVTLDNVA